MVDVNLRIPALEMLVRYTASGIGAVAGPMLATWKAYREAEARLITTRSKADSLKVIANAQDEAHRSLAESGSAGSGMFEIDLDGIHQRIGFQEQKRQANITSVVRDAADEIGDQEIDDHEPDPDWTVKFFNCVQDVSSEDMKRIWVKILAGEVERPGKTSLRTLDILKDMSTKDAKMFNNVCDFVIGGFIFYLPKYQSKQFPLVYSNIIMLHTMGLVYAASSLQKNLEFKTIGQFPLFYQKNLLIIKRNGEAKKINIPAVLITNYGKELYRLSSREFRLDYLQSFSQFLHAYGCSLSYVPKERLNPQRDDNQNILPIPIAPDSAQLDGTNS